VEDVNPDSPCFLKKVKHTVNVNTLLSVWDCATQAVPDYDVMETLTVMDILTPISLLFQKQKNRF